MIFIWARNMKEAKEAAYNSRLDRMSWSFLREPYQLLGRRRSRVWITETIDLHSHGNAEMRLMIQSRECRVTNIKISEGFRLEAGQDA